jgi:hypothetical protein
MWESETNILYYFMLPSQLCSLLCHRKFDSLYKWASFPFLIFQHFKFPYLFYVLYQAITWRNSKTNGRSSSIVLIRCKQSIPTYRLLFRTSLYIATITVSVILQKFSRLATLTFWHPNFFNFFSTPCILNVNNTGTKKVALWNKRHFEEKEMESGQHV